MTGEDPLSQPESCATSTEYSIPGSAGSLARQLEAKKASRFFFYVPFLLFCM